jgi:hypothetical protein
MHLRALVHAILARPGPVDALCYLGDHIAGYQTSEIELRRQWSHFLGSEFLPLMGRFARIYHLPSNHTAYDVASSTIFGETLPPGRAVVSRKGLDHAVRDERALLIFLNTANPRDNGSATLDLDWLRQTLEAHACAPLKLVFGHHPIHPVNGYRRHPLWRLEPDLGREAWSVLREKGVSAYICSHILAFDFQVHEGVAQLCSGGGGTVYGPGGLMPASAEYRHFVECSIDPRAIRCAAYDENGNLRERVDWPPDPAREPGIVVSDLTEAASPLPSPPGWLDPNEARWGFILSLAGVTPLNGSSATLLCGWTAAEGPPILWIGFEGWPPRLVVKAVPVAGDGARIWSAWSLPPGRNFAIEIMIHPGAGPGGVLARRAGDAWSSLASDCARGLGHMVWPECWSVGHGSEGKLDTPFPGALHIHMKAFDPGTSPPQTAPAKGKPVAISK